MTTVIVYVRLPDEAVDVWRPVEATRRADDTYELTGSVPINESWEFAPGQVVRCEMRDLDGGRFLVATERVTP